LVCIKGSHKEIFDYLMAASSGEEVQTIGLTQRAEQILVQLAKLELKTQYEGIEFIGKVCRSSRGCPTSMTDYDCGLQLLEDHIFCHLSDLKDKFDLLIQMLHKLYYFVSPLSLMGYQAAGG